eukprot:CAMPEP_0204354102 /NCGR_PEP_ID=MMETSP0469-20131031/33153_1 /ASSEMBLY_ACC=CAM_ASM_000384 /TAXON_ID=2969 /ORGANISM="Oxyrrhis marina" /LENGTH=540 /DNA_ID=CAMNT_0051341127 /DNA_START=1 /DNA_END=1620 /DNA_ORIENTATION=+
MRKGSVEQIIYQPLARFIVHSRTAFVRMDLNRALECAGADAFLKLMERLQLPPMLDAHSVTGLFEHLEQKQEWITMVRFSLCFEPIYQLEEPLAGTEWSMQRVLRLICRKNSHNAMNFFMLAIKTPQLQLQSVDFIRGRDPATGRSNSMLGAIAWPNLLQAVDHAEASTALTFPQLQPEASPPRQRTFEQQRGSPSERIRLPSVGHDFVASAQPRHGMPQHDVFADTKAVAMLWEDYVAEHTSPGAKQETTTGSPDECLQAVLAVYERWRQSQSYNNADPSGNSLMTYETSLVGQQTGVPNLTNYLDPTAIHLVNSLHELSTVFQHFQANVTVCAVDLEWSEPQAVSLIQIATADATYLIDTLHKSALFMSVLRHFLVWLLGSTSLHKVFFGFPHDLLRLNMLFGELGPIRRYRAVYDCAERRLQRRQVKLSPPEVPLVQDMLLRAALEEDDDEALLSIGNTVAGPQTGAVVEDLKIVDPPGSLQSVVHKHLGVHLDKAPRLSNWNFRPLSAAQVQYAALDAHVLLVVEGSMRRDNILSA